MQDAGYGIEVLREVQKLINAEKSDLFDVLEYIAYATTPIERSERADFAASHLYPVLSAQQKDFIDFILNKYIEAGVTELSFEKLPVLLQMKFGSVNEGINELGSIENVRETFLTFQRYLYQSAI